MQGIITHIQRMSLHDGPGIRSTIFLKGCNLQCKWCHNPETFSLQPELGWAPNKCIHCGVCIRKCREEESPFRVENRPCSTHSYKHWQKLCIRADYMLCKN